MDILNLTEEQSMKAKAWQNAMRRTHPADPGAIGGRFTYFITPTSIGDVVKVRDAISGLVLDLSDYDDW